MNSSEKVERQPSAESGLAAEMSTISQVPGARAQRAAGAAQSPVGCWGYTERCFAVVLSLDSWNCHLSIKQWP